MNNDIIKLDVDGVLRNFKSRSYEVLKYFYPNKTPSKEPVVDEWELSEFYPKFDKRELYNLIFSKHAKLIYSSADCYKNSRNFCNLLYNKYAVIIRTHQNSKCAPVTYHWLVNKGFNFDGFFVTDGSDKKDYLDGLLVDDKVDNIKDKNKGILINRNWNKSFDCSGTNIHRCYSYKQSLKNIKRIMN